MSTAAKKSASKTLTASKSVSKPIVEQVVEPVVEQTAEPVVEPVVEPAPVVDQPKPADSGAADQTGSFDHIEHLDENAKLKDVVLTLNTLIDAFQQLATGARSGGRDRGPDSTRVMVEEDAHRILLGDLALDNNKEAANKLGLSYGQVYSARKGFTFKGVYKLFRDGEKSRKA